MVSLSPAEATAPQMLRSSPLHPIEPNSRRSSDGHLDEALHAGRAVGQDGLGPGLGDDRLPARGDVDERLVPADALEAALALRSDALERVEHAVRVVDALQVVIDLGAQRAAREGMRGSPASVAWPRRR